MACKHKMWWETSDPIVTDNEVIRMFACRKCGLMRREVYKMVLKRRENLE